jgi:hypothetical protein
MPRIYPGTADKVITQCGSECPAYKHDDGGGYMDSFNYCDYGGPRCFDWIRNESDGFPKECRLKEVSTTDQDRKIDYVIGMVSADAFLKQQNAANFCHEGDNGASELEQQLKFYKYGLDKVIPPEWE